LFCTTRGKKKRDAPAVELRGGKTGEKQGKKGNSIESEGGGGERHKTREGGDIGKKKTRGQKRLTNKLGKRA